MCENRSYLIDSHDFDLFHQILHVLAKTTHSFKDGWCENCIWIVLRSCCLVVLALLSQLTRVCCMKNGGFRGAFLVLKGWAERICVLNVNQ